MKYEDISVDTFITWTKITSFSGSSTTPLDLLVKIKNNTDRTIDIKCVCISVKNNFLCFSKNTLKNHNRFTIPPNGYRSVTKNIRLISKDYNDNKKFTAKVITNNKGFESDILTINILKNTQSFYI